jgi:hypothetical protein
MSTTYRYTLPVEQIEWKFDGNTETCFAREYDEPREALLQLYARGKKQQWDAAERTDSSQDRSGNPMMLNNRVLSEAERKEREDFVVTACWHIRDRFNQWGDGNSSACRLRMPADCRPIRVNEGVS